jgi:hypothetical protein
MVNNFILGSTKAIKALTKSLTYAMAGKESYFLFNICINFVNKENE